MIPSIAVVTRRAGLALTMSSSTHHFVEVRPVSGWQTREWAEQVVVLDLETAESTLSAVETLTGAGVEAPLIVVAGDSDGWDEVLSLYPELSLVSLPIMPASMLSAVDRAVRHARVGAAPPAEPDVDAEVEADVEPEVEAEVEAEPVAEAVADAVVRPAAEADAEARPAAAPVLDLTPAVPQQPRVREEETVAPVVSVAPEAATPTKGQKQRRKKTPDVRGNAEPPAAAVQAAAPAVVQAAAPDVVPAAATVSTDRPVVERREVAVEPEPPPRRELPHVPDSQRALMDMVRTLSRDARRLSRVHEVAEVMRRGCTAVVDCQASAVLVPDGEVWRVSAGEHLRPLEERLQIGADHWLVTEVVAAGHGVLIEDTDIARTRLSGSPLVSWPNLLALPVAEAGALVLLAREGKGFGRGDLTRARQAVDDAASQLRDAVDVRDLARRLAAFADPVE